MDRIRKLETDEGCEADLMQKQQTGKEAEAENIYYETSFGRTFGCERRIKGEIVQV